ncbi:MAG: 50S ribosomal protein L13 [Parcubacteria group bacterium GW2011_GWA2_51_12]|nr:MAG: 50S ribosomal protein L13 [Parcubacteria group bacterium GW2011_GWA2_51_12]
MKTTLPKISEIKRAWVQIDASLFPLGRLATQVATILRGKHKRTFTPHMDLGDFVVVINASNLKLTGRKMSHKELISFSGYPGGITRRPVAEVLRKSPEKIIIHAVRNMLPVNRLRTLALRRLKIVPDDKHNFKIDRKIEA